MALITALLIQLLCPTAIARPAVDLGELNRNADAYIGRTLILNARIEIIGRATWLRDETNVRSRTVKVVFRSRWEARSPTGVARLIRQARRSTGIYQLTPGLSAISARAQTARVILEGRLVASTKPASSEPNVDSSQMPDVSGLDLPYTFVVTRILSYHTVKSTRPTGAAEQARATERAHQSLTDTFTAVARAR